MSIVIAHPFVSPTLTVTLPSAELGNARQHNLDARFGIAMNGRVHSFIRDTSDDIISNFITVTNMTATVASALLALINTAAGSNVKITDWNGDVWQANITSSPVELITNSIDKCSEERKSVVLEFEGAIQ